MTLRALGAGSYGLVAPFAIGSKDIGSTVSVVLARAEVQVILVIEGRGILTVDIGAVRLLRAEDANLIAAVVIVGRNTTGSQSAIAHKEIVVAIDVFNVAGFARSVVATGNLLAEIGVDGDIVALAHLRIGHVIVAQTGLLVKLQHVDATAPRTIREPQFAVLVVEHAGIDTVGITLAPTVASGIA